MVFRVGDIVIGCYHSRKMWKWLVLTPPVKHFPLGVKETDTFFHSFLAYNFMKRKTETVAYSEATVNDFEVVSSL